MQRRLITVILFALLAALVSSTVLYRVISAGSSRPATRATTAVLVAAGDLEAGALIKESDVLRTDWAGPVAPQWVVRREDIAGRGLIAAINKGEPFPENRLAPKGAGAGLSSRIPPGMRVIPVHLDEQSGLARFMVPGTHVDVLSTASRAGENGQGMMTRTILQNVEVLSTGANGGQDAKDKTVPPQTVNLLVSPQQAEILSQAIAQNRIQLVLRNPLDKGSMADAARVSAIPSPGASSRETPHVPHPVPAPVEKVKIEEKKPPPLTIEIIHGTKKVITEVGPAVKEELTQ